MTVAAGQIDVPHPAQFTIVPDTGERNRLTVLFRWILAIPHVLLVGAPTLAFAFGFGWLAEDGWLLSSGSSGVLGAVAGVCAVIAWFAILFANQHPRGLWDFGRMYIRWRTRALAYMMLLRDEYPPFGDGEYAASAELDYPDGPRDKLSVGLRLIYVIPHWFVLFFLWIGWFFTAIVAWFAILFTGRYPGGLVDFAVGVMRWSLRVEAYTLLLHDEYPPFSLQP